MVFDEAGRRFGILEGSEGQMAASILYTHDPLGTGQTREREYVCHGGTLIPCRYLDTIPEDSDNRSNRNRQLRPL